MYCVEKKCVINLPSELGKLNTEVYPSSEYITYIGENDGGVFDSKLTFLNCKAPSDCKEDKRPYCFEEKCVSGYIKADFKIGHPVIDRKALVVRCKDQSQCKSWQQCHLAYCRDTVGTQSRAKGKIKGLGGIYLGDFSYSEIIQKDGVETMRIVFLGTLSDKLQEHLIIEIALNHFNLGSHLIDGSNIKATLFEIRVDLNPHRLYPKAIAVGGLLKILYAGSKLGAKVAGYASLIMQ